MKIPLALTLLILALLGCSQKQNHVSEHVIEKDQNSDTGTIAVKNEAIKMELLKSLIPIDIVDSTNKNTFEKYGLEFSGNCYVCDLANLTITENIVKLTNVCDENQSKFFEVAKIITNSNLITLKIERNEFEFTKIDPAPIFELKIKGNGLEIENLRIAKYYTLKKLLKKFKQNACGDFQG